MKIRLTVEHLEGNQARLRDEKGRLIIWPRDWLPEKTVIKEVLECAIGNGQDNSDELPKKILNEILSAN